MSKTRNKLKLTGLLLTVVMIVSLLGAFSLTASAAAADDLTVPIDTGASVTLKDTDGDGYYEIENADGLYAFAALTEAKNHQNVELTNNIIVNDVTFTYANDTLTVTDKEGNTVDVSTLRPWTPIGKDQNSNTAYNKVIEGNGYYISGLYCNTTTEDNGLFAKAGTGIKIKNLGVVNSCFIGKSVNYNGTFIGYSSEATIQNCYSNAIIVGYFYTGGFVGMPHAKNYLTIENSCYFGTLVNTSNGGVFCSEEHFRQNINNSYYLDGCAKYEKNEAAVAMTAEQFATGEVAYRLGDAWGQTIGTDAYPSLGGAKVYYGYTSCADDAVKVYTNIAAGDTKPEHSGITYELNANDNTKHDKKYSCCNKVLIEEHTGGTATCVAKAVCAHCGTSYGELGGHSFDSDGNCTVCPIRAMAYVEASDFELGMYVKTYYETLPEALAAVPQGPSSVGALANYNDDLVIDIDFDANGYTFSGDITVNASINKGGKFTGNVTINSGRINKATFDGEVIVKGDIEMLDATFNNTVTVETSGQISGDGSEFNETVTNNGIIRGGNYHCNVINNGVIYSNKLEHPIFFGTVTNNGTIDGGYFSGATLINADTVKDHCSEYYVYEGNFEYVQLEGGKVTGDHTLTYTASGNVISATCSAKCGYVCTATVSAANTTYDGTEQKTATITYSEGWPGGELTVSYANNVNAGTATASITLDEATASVEFTIAKADPSVVPPELASGQVYTGLIFSPFSSLGSTTGGELQVQVNDREWASPNNYYISDAGTYRVGYRVVGNENYNNVEPVYFTLEIAKRDFSNPAHKVSAVLDAESFVYDGTAKKPAVTVTFDKCIDEDEGRYIGVKVTADNYIVSYSENVNAGTATVTITGTGTNCTGKITKTFKITKAPLTVTAENKTMTTGQPLQPFTYTITGFVNGETENVLTAKPTVSCEADGQTAGTYNITPSGAAADNYEITYVNGTLSVIDHQHAWTYTADGDTLTATCATADTCPLKTATIKIAAEGKTYDGTPVTATLTGSIDGVVNPTVSYSGNTDAGTHTASITLGESTASVEFTIAKADSTLTAPNAITDLVYNGSNQALVSAGSSTTGTVQYKLNDGEWSTNVPTATEAGEYTVYYKLVGDKNHKDVAEASVKVAILSKSAANAEVSFNGSLVYDGNAKTPEITVVFEQKELVPMKDYIVSCSNNVNAGTAAVEITFIGNYEGKVVKSFTIAPRQLVIFWENTNMIYNGNRQTPTAKLFGIIPGDEVGYTVSGWGKFGGTYTAKVEKLTNPNYVLPADATCRFTIDANPIEVAIDVAVDIYDIIPDSAKEAVANAAINAAENALNDAKNAATECINSAVDQITDCVSTKAQEAANAAKSLAGALCELWQNLCNRVSCFF